MEQMFMTLPGLQPEEMILIQNILKEMDEKQKQQFFALYQGRRKDPQTILILTLVGFFGVAGIQRFLTGETGLGIAYLLTAGFCGIGTIVDVVNYKKLAFTYNQKQAFESAGMVKALAS